MVKVITCLAFIIIGSCWIFDVGHFVSAMSNLHARQLRLNVDRTRLSYGYRVGGLFFVGIGIAILFGAN